MAVFEVFAREKRELSNADIARLLSVAESSSSDLLHTLHVQGYLMRTARTRRFYPTQRLLDMARQIAENDPLDAVARETVELLAEKTNESAFFGLLDRGAVRVAATQPSRLPLRYMLDVGERVALHASGLGKALLGLLGGDEAREQLDGIERRAVTAHTVVNLDELMSQVARGRELGWYEAHDEGTDGVSALAVSGWLGDQPVSLSVAGPAERIETNRDAYLGALTAVRDAMLAAN